ncbi:MAG: RNA-guided endonuclease IscB [Xenococcaceae cyanobacterium MO_167.B52]|nr:RNA-guided endonuclease IscB [Xenococcaceae cyanobacterium MO_167.B52]
MIKPNYVLVLDTNKTSLTPCKPSMAKKLLNANKAAVYRRFPFTIILKKRCSAVLGVSPMSDCAKKECTPSKNNLELKIDPGSVTTGLALVLNSNLIWVAQLNHRGSLIKKKLESRRASRRLRRSKLRYRKPRFLNRTRSDGWFPPSLMHRVLTIMTWVKRLIKFAPINSIAVELVRFDAQKLESPEISGVEYQQGELTGYEVREYLLEKWGRKCTYCSKEKVPLQVEHIVPRAKNGSNRVSNLCLACEKCNQKKGTKSIEQFLAKKPSLLKSILVQAKKPLRDAAAVNATRWKLFNTLKETGKPISTGTGGQTKFNRCRFGLEKTHFYDAACVGQVNNLEVLSNQPLIITCKGHGGRQKAALNKYGYPIRYNPLKPIKGWQSGDLAVDGDGNLGRVNPRSKSNSFNFTVFGQKAKSIHVDKLKRVHQRDGYTYAH